MLIHSLVSVLQSPYLCFVQTDPTELGLFSDLSDIDLAEQGTSDCPVTISSEYDSDDVLVS